MQKRHRKLATSSLVIVVLAATAWFIYGTTVDTTVADNSTEDTENNGTTIAHSAPTLGRSTKGTPSLSNESEGGSTGAATDWWQPGQKHRYDEHPDAFIRQPLDYSPDTPRLLGAEIGVSLFDLERIADMIHRGTESNSAISRVLGRPLQTTEQQKARQLLQQFFDEAMPVVDAILGSEMTPQEGEAFFKPRRQQLNHELRAALAITEPEFFAIWPHLAPNN